MDWTRLGNEVNGFFSPEILQEALAGCCNQAIPQLRSTTADVYTRTIADADRTAALALEDAIFGDLFQVVPSFGTWNKKPAAN